MGEDKTGGQAHVLFLDECPVDPGAQFKLRVGLHILSGQQVIAQADVGIEAPAFEAGPEIPSAAAHAAPHLAADRIARAGV